MALVDEGWSEIARPWRIEEMARLSRAGDRAPSVRIRGDDGVVLDSVLYEAFAIWRARHGYDTHDRVSEAALVRSVQKQIPGLVRVPGVRIGTRRGRGLKGLPVDDPAESAPVVRIVPPPSRGGREPGEDDDRDDVDFQF